MILLPPKLVVAAPATLAVLDPAGRLVAGATVELSSGEKVTTDATGRAEFLAPDTPGVLLANIPARKIDASTTVLLSPSALASASPENPPEGVRIFSYPHFLAIHDRFTVEGTGFRGKADDDRVFLADQQCLVLASSPLSMVVLPGPHTPIGQADLLVTVAGRGPGPDPVTLVLPEVSGPAESMTVGQKGTLTVALLGTDQRLVVEVHNFSPKLVDLARGNVQRVTTSGGARNIAQIEMACLAAGDYTIAVRLIPSAAGLPDMETARQKLLAARAIAPADWQARVDAVIHHIERNPQDIARIRAELERLLAAKPGGQFAQLLNSAWEELMKN